jgi:hypothetical protein
LILISYIKLIIQCLKYTFKNEFKNFQIVLLWHLILHTKKNSMKSRILIKILHKLNFYKDSFSILKYVNYKKYIYKLFLYEAYYSKRFLRGRGPIIEKKLKLREGLR